jgi:hypothetical protein
MTASASLGKGYGMYEGRWVLETGEMWTCTLDRTRRRYRVRWGRVRTMTIPACRMASELWYARRLWLDDAP